MKLDHIQAVFTEIEAVGTTGKELADTLLVINRKIASAIKTFEDGMASDVWSANFAAFAGSDSMEYAEQVYIVLLETKAKLDALG